MANVGRPSLATAQAAACRMPSGRSAANLIALWKGNHRGKRRELRDWEGSRSDATHAPRGQSNDQCGSGVARGALQA